MSNNLTEGLQKQYILVLTVIGFLSICGAVLLEAAILSQEKGGEVINIAGRQRMLSQRISLYAARLYSVEAEHEKNAALHNLRSSVDTFKTSHSYLTGDNLLIKAPAELRELYQQTPDYINRDVATLISNVNMLIDYMEKGKRIPFSLVDTIAHTSESMLPKLDHAVAIHQEDLERKTQKIKHYQWINVGILLLVLILSAVFVFQRILSKLQSRINDIAEAEERFRSVTHSAEISVVVASGAEGIIEAWNPAAVRTFGYEEEEVLGKPVSMLMPERYRKGHDMGIRHAYESEDYKLVGNTIEIEALHKDGHEFPIELSLGSWQSNERKFFSAIIHDISERKNHEREKENLRNQLMTAIESMTEGFALFDKNDRLVICNSVFRDFYSNHLEAIQIGVKLETLLRAGLAKKSFPQAIGHEEEWLEGRLKYHRNPKGPIEQQLADGRWLLISEHKTKDGGIVGVRTDITERRKSEEELRKLKKAIEQSRSAIIITDADGVIEYANPFFAQSSGYNSEEIIGQKPSILSSKLEPADKFRDLWQTILSGKVWQGTIQNRKKDGTLFVEDTVISPIRNDRGRITHFLAIKDDITEQLRLEDNLKKRQKLEAVGQLAGGLAHDFNNLLAIIAGNLELLQRQIKNDEKASKKAETALKATNRGAKLTKQLLGFTRQSATSIETLSVNDIIQEVSPLLEHSLSKSILLKLSLADDAYLADIDAGDFEDCLVNLAVNAKHAIEHDGELLIETENVERNFELENTPAVPQQYVQITISDNGCGIAEGLQDKIFEPFFTTKEKGKGTGLGLAMVFGFVRRSNGHIRVYSEEGVGTSFQIYLPRSQSCYQQLLKPTCIKEDLPKGTEKVLIVDDEIELLDLAKSHLEEAGYKVTHTTLPAEAVELIKGDQNFDLLFSDVVMPGNMNGFDLAVATLQASPTTKIQLTSGFTAQAGQDLIAGNLFAKQLYNNLLPKPYGRASLLQAVRQTLDAKSLIEWTSDLNTGIKQIDDDHKMLVALLNRLYQACLYKESEGTFRSILNELAHYTVFHFKREEAFMEKMGYPHIKNHKQVHELLTSYVMNEIEKVQLDYTTKSGDELLHFLKNWLIDHIMGMDKDIGFYNEQKIKLNPLK